MVCFFVHFARSYSQAVINPRRACTARVTVCVCVCYSTSHLSDYSFHTRDYLTGNEGQKFCAVSLKMLHCWEGEGVYSAKWRGSQSGGGVF